MRSILLVMCLFGLTVSANAFVLGKVDVKRILESVEEGKKIKAKLQGVLTKKQKVLETEKGKIRKEQENYQKQSMVMNDKAKAKKEREIQKMMFDLQQKSMEFQKSLQADEQKLMQPILKKLNDIVLAISKKSNVDMTVEVRSTPVVYAKNEKDMTEAVIKEYNKKYPGKK